MRDYSMELAQIAAGIMTDVLGGKNPVKVSYSTDGNNIIFELDNYPMYIDPAKNNALVQAARAVLPEKKGKVFAQMPRSTFSVRKGTVCPMKVQQAQFRYYEGKIGNALSHPHVYNDGHPCWADGTKTRYVDLICNIIETFTLTNVTWDSVFVGRCASGVMGVTDTALRNSKIHHNLVMETLGCKKIIENQLEFEKYVAKRWSTLITLFMKTI